MKLSPFFYVESGCSRRLFFNNVEKLDPLRSPKTEITEIENKTVQKLAVLREEQDFFKRINDLGRRIQEFHHTKSDGSSWLYRHLTTKVEELGNEIKNMVKNNQLSPSLLEEFKIIHDELVRKRIPQTIKSPEKINWEYGLESKFITLNYHNLDDLKHFNKSIIYADQWKLVTAWFNKASIHEQVCKELDAVFERVVEILEKIEIKAQTQEKITINLYSNHGQLSKAGRQIGSTNKKSIAFYSYEHNTIYLNVQNLKWNNVITHELAHAIIDDYLLRKPPNNPREEVARFVDRWFDYGKPLFKYEIPSNELNKMREAVKKLNPN